MARRIRLDADLVRRGLARSRQQAGELITAGEVLVRGVPARKPATLVDPADPVRLRRSAPADSLTDSSAVGTAELAGVPASEFVSRGAHKLIGALRALGPEGPAVAGRRCLDAGASTGGFTDVLLRAGAAEVVAVDVGYGQLAWRLRTDPRVRVHERTNVRTLTPAAIGGPVALTVADLSFISLRLVLPAVASCTDPDGDLLLMVKPQFEVGRGRVGAGGVVRDPALRAEAVLAVASTAAELGWGTAGVAASPLPGPAGNREFFGWFRRDAAPPDPERIRAATEPAGSTQPATSAGPSEEVHR